MTLMQGSIGDGRERTALIDPIANGIITLPNNHSYIHKGGHFKIGVSDELALTNDYIRLAITTPQDNPQYRAEDTLYHMVFRYWHNQPCSWQVIEGGSPTGGVVVTPTNNLRRSAWAQTTELTFLSQPTAWTGGSIIQGPHYLGSRSDSSANRDDDEYILDANINYLFQLTQLANGANYCGLEVAWYEYVPEL